MTIVFCLLLAAQQPPATRPAPPVPTQPPATTQPRRAAPSTATMEVHVTDRSGTPASGAHVSVIGPTMREGTTDASGVVTFRTMVPGTYRVRAEGDGLITLEKEIAVKAAGPALVADFALAAAPKPPAPEPKREEPPPLPPPAPPAGVPGEPRVLSIPDLAERSLSGRDPIKILPIGCTGLSESRLIVLREAIPAKASTDTDETIYLVAGEASLTLGGKVQALAPGWFSVVPRGTPVGITRKGRNPAILLSVVYGKPCGGN